jgi:hypothetical protein
MLKSKCFPCKVRFQIKILLVFPSYAFWCYFYYTFIFFSFLQADPAIPDKDGISPQTLAVNIAPHISVLFGRVRS